MYVVGQTGVGKSVYLENLALQDMIEGNGFAFIDPHGDTAEKLLSMVPKERTEDVIYFCPADTDYPLGLNIFEAKTDDQKDFVIQEVINVLYKLYDPQRQGIIGPRYEHIFRNAALTVMAGPEGGTFIDIPKLFSDPEFVNKKLEHIKDQNVIDFWRKEMVQAKRSNEFGDVVSWFVSKFGAFLSNSMMRNIIGQTQSSFDIREIMDNKKILLVNLSKGRTGELNSKLLGMIFVMKFQAAAMSRANIPEDQRVDFCLYVDEFQNFSTDSFATIMSEARKYRLSLTVANQFTTQLTDEIRDAVFGNMGTIVAFRIGQNDVESLGRYFQPLFDGDDLLRIPNYNTIVRTLIGGVPTQPFSMATIPPLGSPSKELGDALRQLSAAKFGRPRAIVEKEIFARIITEPTSVSSALGQAPPAGVRPQQNPASKGNQQASFLDQWLAKKKQQPVAGVTPANSPQPARRPTDEVNPQTPTSTPMNPNVTPNAATQPVVQQTSTPTKQEVPQKKRLRGNDIFIGRDGKIGGSA
ncbi:MAG: type IV secretory system conjugative DNA transfer family protein [Patescibacteria group bacterium]